KDFLSIEQSLLKGETGRSNSGGAHPPEGSHPGHHEEHPHPPHHDRPQGDQPLPPPPPSGEKPGSHYEIPPLPKDAIDVKNFGARGDGKTDDTAAIQKAIDSLGPKGGTVEIPPGTYMIRAGWTQGKGIHLRDNVTLQMSPDTVLKAVPNSDSRSSIL